MEQDELLIANPSQYKHAVRRADIHKDTIHIRDVSVILLPYFFWSTEVKKFSKVLICQVQGEDFIPDLPFRMGDVQRFRGLLEEKIAQVSSFFF